MTTEMTPFLKFKKCSLMLNLWKTNRSFKQAIFFCQKQVLNRYNLKKIESFSSLRAVSWKKDQRIYVIFFQLTAYFQELI